MKKDYTISYIRLLATTMIVILHIFQRIGGYEIVTTWLNLGVTFFFCISGYLYAQKTIEKPLPWLGKRFTEILVPNMLTVYGTLLVYSMLVAPISIERIVSSLLCGAGMTVFVPDSWMFMQTWFITYILVCYLCVPFLQKISFAKLSPIVFWFGLPCAVVLIQVLSVGIKMIVPVVTLSAGILLRFLLPYALYRRYKDDQSRMKTIMLRLTPLAIICLIVFCILYYHPLFAGLSLNLKELLLIYTQSFVGTVLFYWSYLLFSCVKPREKLLKYSDMLSYPIFLTHCLFIGYKTSFLFITDSLTVGIIVSLSLTLVSAVVLYVLSDNIKKLIFCRK